MSDKLLKLHGKAFSLAEASEKGINRAHIRKWLDEGEIEKVAHGLYRAYSYDLSLKQSLIEATSIVGEPCAICLLSALEYYNLTDQISKKVWLLTSAAKQTRNKKVRLYRKKEPNWEIGINKHEGYSITSIDRTLVECLIRRNILGSSVVINAVKLALYNEVTTINEISKMARELKGYKRVEGILEALI